MRVVTAAALAFKGNSTLSASLAMGSATFLILEKIGRAHV